jgi:acetaldehyde dehydrogenase/alcohol dehydrogenase
MLWFRVPPKVYFKYGALPVAIRELAGKKRAFIVTDKPLFDLGVTAPLQEILEEIGITVNIFYDVEPDPSLETVERRFKCD